MFTYCHNGLLGTEIAIKNAINLLQGSTHFTEPHNFFCFTSKLNKSLMCHLLVRFRDNKKSPSHFYQHKVWIRCYLINMAPNHFIKQLFPNDHTQSQDGKANPYKEERQCSLNSMDA